MQNPLETYRRTQRELRHQFETFTRANCPSCPTPCCRRPARILPTDILLAETTGWRARVVTTDKIVEIPTHTSESAPLVETAQDIVSELAGRTVEALYDPPESGEAEANGSPCEFLGKQGCTFPRDLRPFGCTTFICRYMYARLDRKTLSRIKRLVRELEERHLLLMRTLSSVPRKEMEET
jgi:hypothetical protein